jgi:RNA polymerase sigma factor (sigma-70 family)
MAVPINRLYGYVSERWNTWLAVRLCIRLARPDRPATNLPAMVDPKSVDISLRELDSCSEEEQNDDELAQAISELSTEQRLVLHFFKQGATYREIAAALRLSDERVLRELKTVLRRLADQLFPPSTQ